MDIPAGHVRGDDLVAFVQSFGDDNGTYGVPAKFDSDANGFALRFDQFENSDGAFGLAIDRARDIKNIGHALEFDGAINAEVRPRAARQFAIELHIHRDGALHRGWINSND